MMNKFLLSLLLIISAPSAFTAESPLNIKNGLALQGYDPVAYFAESAIKGDKQYSTEYNGITYYFVSMQNRDTFIQAPENFLPEYGGWCAYAMLEGDTVNVNPERFKLVDGKLYLFYDGFWGDTLKKWNELTQDTPESELITTADKKWDELNK